MTTSSVHCADDNHLALSDRASLAPPDAAFYVGIAISTLKRWRADGTGPRYVKIGSTIRYRPADLDAFLAEHLVGGEG